MAQTGSSDQAGTGSTRQMTGQVSSFQTAQITDGQEPPAQTQPDPTAERGAFDDEALAALAEAGITPDDVVQQAINQGLIPPGADLEDPEVVAELRGLISELTGVLLEPAAPAAAAATPPDGPPAGGVPLGGGGSFAPNDPGELPPGIAINDLLPPTGLEFGLITADVLPFEEDDPLEDPFAFPLPDDPDNGGGGDDCDPACQIACENGTSESFGYDPGTPSGDRPVAWDGVTLTAIASDGTVLQSGIVFDNNGVGVLSGIGTDPTDPADDFNVPRQINHTPPLDGVSQELTVAFDEPVCEARVTVSNLIFGEAGTNEIGVVEVWREGELLGTLEFGGTEADPPDSDIIRLEDTSDPGVGSFTIDAEVLGLCACDAVFDTLVFSAAPYEDNVVLPDDSSDYYVREIEVIQPAPVSTLALQSVATTASGAGVSVLADDQAARAQMEVV